MPLSGCLSRGSRGRDCCVLCVIYVSFEKLYILVGFGLRERCLRGTARYRSLCGAGKAVWVRAWGVWFVSGACYLQVCVFSGNWSRLVHELHIAQTIRVFRLHCNKVGVREGLG